MRKNEITRLVATSMAYLLMSQSMLACQGAPTARNSDRVGVERANDALVAGPPTSWVLLPASGGSTSSLGSSPFTTGVSADGQATVSIPLWVPPGRGNSQPNLALSYVSSQGDGLLGLGWTIAGLSSSIARCGKNPASDGLGVWAPAATSGVFCLDGVRLVATAVANEFRTDPESFQKVIFDSIADKWLVMGRDGSRRTFAHQIRPTGVTTVAAWLMTEMQDPATNYLTVTYEDEGRPSRIDYSGNRAANLTPTKSVTFVYDENRNNPLTFNVMGGTLQTSKRLTKIEMRSPTGVVGATTPAKLVRVYKLSYRTKFTPPSTWVGALPTPESTQHDLLSSVQECDGFGQYIPQQGQNEACKAPIEFAVSDARVLFGAERTVASASSAIEGVSIADLNDDGLNDLLYQVPSPQGRKWKGRLQLSSGFSSEFDPQLPAVSVSSPFPAAIDFDGDGRSELLGPIAPSLSTTNFYTIYVNSSAAGLDPSYVGSSTYPEVLSGRALIGDLNGDGRPDILDAAYWDPMQTGYPTADLYVRWNQSTPGNNIAFSAPAPWIVETCSPAGPLPGTSLSAECYSTGSGGPTDCYQCTAHDIVASSTVPATATRVLVSPNTTRAVKSRFGVNRSGTGGYGLENFVVDIDSDGRSEVLFRDATDDVWEYRNALGQVVSTTKPPGLLSAIIRRSNAPGASPASTEVGRTESNISLSALIDANGDGFRDLVALTMGSPRQLNVSYNNGLGHLAAPVSTPVGNGPDVMRFVDVDMDGREDVINFTSKTMMSFSQWGHWYTGMGTTRLGPAPESPPGVPPPPGWNAAGDSPELNLHIADMNADTLPDIVMVRGTNILVRDRQGERPGLIKSIHQGGRWEHFTYGPLEGSANYESPTVCEAGQRCVKSGMMVVTQHSQGTFTSSTGNATSYAYRDGRIDLQGRGWLGFATVSAKNEVTGVVAETRYGIGINDRVSCSDTSCAGRYFYPYSLKPREAISCVDFRTMTTLAGRAQRVDGVSSSTFSWVNTDTPGRLRLRIDSTRQDTTEREGELIANAPFGCSTPIGSSLASLAATRSSRTESSFSEGAPTLQIESVWAGDFGASGSLPTSPPGGIFEQQTTTALYPADTTNWLRGLAKTTTIVSREPGLAQVARTLDFEYAPGTSMLSTVTRMKGVAATTSDFESKKEYRRDAANNVDRTDWIASGTTRRIETDYDSSAREFVVATRAFPVLGQPALETKSWVEVSTGLVAKVDDENSLPLLRRYDTFGRLRSEESNSAPKRSVEYSDEFGVPKVTESVELLRSGTTPLVRTSTTLFDVLDRPVVNRATGWRGRIVERTAIYDRLGRLTHESLPRFEGEAPEYSVFSYDKLDRLTLRSNSASGDSETQSYEGLTRTIVDSRGMLTKLLFDAKGRMVRSSNYDGTRELRTSFAYGAFDSLVGVTDPLLRQRQMIYDALGRREKLIDPDSGTTEARYNGFDDEKWSKDARTAVVEHQFDGLGRVTTANLTPGGGVAQGRASNTATYVWDSAPMGKGRIAVATSMDGVVTTSTYTSKGQPESQTWTIPGRGSYSFSTAYDSNGRASQVSYPTGFTASYEYDLSGKVANVFWLGAQTPRIFHVEEVNAAGQVVSEEFGNQAVTSRVYDSAYRLTFQQTLQHAIVEGGNDTYFQKLKYEYGPGSELVAKHDPTKDLSEYFVHDFANRLKEWRVVQTTGATCRGGIMNYDYDDAGNLSTRTVTGANFSIENQFGPQVTSSGTLVPGGVNALTSTKEGAAPKSYYSYDAAGNQKAVFYQRAPTSPSDLGDRQFTWTHFNLPQQVQDSILGTGLSTFSYDANNGRVLETLNNQQRTRVTLGRLFEEDDQGAINRTFGIIVEGRVVAQFTKRTELNGFQHQPWAAYLHQDVLGSPDAVTTGAAGSPTLLERGKYDPFGERRNSEDLFTATSQFHTRNVSFTGHAPDDAFALTNMRGRLYDQHTGRFVSADPLISTPALGQSYNRYSYVLNDPLHFTDPSGFTPEIILTIFGVGLTLGQLLGWILASVVVGAGLFAAMFGAGAPLVGSAGALGATPSGSPDAGSSSLDDQAGGGSLSDAGTEPAKVFKMHDGLPIEYVFDDTDAGWKDYNLARRAIDNGMRYSDPINQGLNYMRYNGSSTLIKLRSSFDMKGKNGYCDLPMRTEDGGFSNGGKLNVIQLRESEANHDTYFNLNLSGRMGKITMPGTFATTVLHEVGHWVGGAENGYRSTRDPRNIINTRAIQFDVEAIRFLGIPLSPLQQKAAEEGLHPEME